MALAALWRGEASTGAAEVKFDSGRLFLFGSRTKAGSTAFKTVQGWRFHAKGSVLPVSERAAWSLPASQALVFQAIVMKHWPLVATDALTTVVETAKNFKPTAEELPAIKLKDVGVHIYAINGMLKAKTPFNMNFVNDLQTKIPKEDREWDPTAKEWIVHASYEAVFKQLVSDHFNVVV